MWRTMVRHQTIPLTGMICPRREVMIQATKRDERRDLDGLGRSERGNTRGTEGELSKNAMAGDKGEEERDEPTKLLEKRKQKEISATPDRATVDSRSVASGAANGDVAVNSDRDPPVAKRQSSKTQMTLDSWSYFLPDGIVTSPDGAEEGVLEDINVRGDETMERVEKVDGFSAGADFEIPSTGGRKAKGSKKKLSRKTAPALKTPESGPPKQQSTLR